MRAVVHRRFSSTTFLAALSRRGVAQEVLVRHVVDAMSVFSVCFILVSGIWGFIFSIYFLHLRECLVGTSNSGPCSF